MNAPPPFSPPEAPARKNRTGLIVAIVLACILIPCIGLIVIVAMMWNFASKTAFPLAACGMGFSHVRQAIKTYSKEHDGMFPPAATWQDDVRPYYKKILEGKREEFGPIEPMAADGDWGCKIDETHRTGMAFNIDLGGKKVADVKDTGTILIFEIEAPKRNATEKYKQRSRESAPKIVGKPRPWMEIPIEGGSDFDMDGPEIKIK